MFKRGGMDAYDIEASLFKMIKDKLSDALGVEVTQGAFLQIGFDENKNKLTIQTPKSQPFSEFCSLCGSIGVIHFEEEGDIHMHRCLRCLAQWDDCAISKKDIPRERLLHG